MESTRPQTLLFKDRSSFSARAWFLGTRFELSQFETSSALSSKPLTIRAGEQGYAILLRFGVAVLIGLSPIEEAEFIKALDNFLTERFENPETEEADFIIDPDRSERIDSAGAFILRSTSLERIQTVSFVLAKSVVLSHYEKQVGDVFARIENLAEQLSRGDIPTRSRELLREIGNVLSIQVWTVGRVEVTEKPEITWDEPDLDRLYERMAYEYELRDRDLALSRKLEIVSQTAETFLEVLHNRQSIRVEWYIVLLILIEVALIIFDIYVSA